MHRSLIFAIALMILILPGISYSLDFSKNRDFISVGFELLYLGAEEAEPIDARHYASSLKLTLDLFKTGATPYENFPRDPWAEELVGQTQERFTSIVKELSVKQIKYKMFLEIVERNVIELRKAIIHSNNPEDITSNLDAAFIVFEKEVNEGVVIDGTLLDLKYITIGFFELERIIHEQSVAQNPATDIKGAIMILDRAVQLLKQDHVTKSPSSRAKGVLIQLLRDYQKVYKSIANRSPDLETFLQSHNAFHLQYWKELTDSIPRDKSLRRLLEISTKFVREESKPSDFRSQCEALLRRVNVFRLSKAQ